MPITSHQPLEIVTIGESMIMLVADAGRTLETTDTVTLHSGGAESNVAHYLAQLGHRVGWASRVGDDQFGRRLVKEFADAGIDVSHVAIAPGEPTGVYFKDPHVTPSVRYYRSDSAASDMRFEDLDLALSGSARLHVTGITAALNDQSADLLFDLIRSAKRRGLPVSFDVNHRPSLWNVERASSVLASLARLVDIVFVGRDEAEALWETTTAESVRAMFPDVPVLVVKDGAIGANAFIGKKREFVRAPKVEVLEPVGAGDAFAAGFLAGLLKGCDTVVALRLGHLVAASAITTHADRADLPSEDELLRLARSTDDVWDTFEFAPAAHTS